VVLVDVPDDIHRMFAPWTIYQKRHLLCTS